MEPNQEAGPKEAGLAPLVRACSASSGLLSLVAVALWRATFL